MQLIPSTRAAVAQVKNKQPAPMQITAEQILREARERQEDENYTAPAQKITDPEELAVYRLKERKHFEDRLRMSKNAMGTWLKYAAFAQANQEDADGVLGLARILRWYD